MKDIKLTINGNRKIPLTIPEELAERLSNNNEEIAFRVVVSPTGAEIVLSQDDQPSDIINKVKIVSLELI